MMALDSLMAVDYAAVALAFIGAFTLVLSAPGVGARIAVLHPDWAREIDRMTQEFGMSGPTAIGWISVGATVVFLMAFLGLVPSTLLAVVAVILLAPLALGRQQAADRARRLEQTLPSALQQVSNEMRGGRSLDQALLAAAETAPEPAAQELLALQRRLAVQGLDEALETTVKRLNSENFMLTASVLRVGQRRGGNLIAALRQLSRTLTELERLRVEIRTASANGRRIMAASTTAYVVYVFFQYGLTPGAFAQATSHSFGVIAFLASGLAALGSWIMFLWLCKVKV